MPSTTSAKDPSDTSGSTHRLECWSDARSRSWAALSIALLSLLVALQWLGPVWSWSYEVGGIPFRPLAAGAIALVCAYWILVSTLQLCASFGPRLEVRADSSCVVRGETLRGSWAFDRRPRGLEHLSLRIEARRYRESSRAVKGWADWRKRAHYHDFEVLASYPLVELERAADIPRGRFEFQAPEEIPRAHQSGQVLVTWVLIAHGRVPIWPDFVAEFSLQPPGGRRPLRGRRARRGRKARR